MRIVIIQEAGRHEKNRNFREALNLHRALSSVDGIESKVWGLNYPEFSTPFSEIERWADVLFVIENYTSYWMPLHEIASSKKLKIFWSIDSHCVLQQHVQMCGILKVDILLNSIESFIPMFDGLVKESHWFPPCYPDDLVFPLPDVVKNVDVGFCGNVLNRGHIIDSLDYLGIKKDIFVIGDDMVRAVNSYKIHINCNISNDINYRTFETTGCDTFLITNYTPGLEKLFDIGKELEIYRSIDELKEKVEYYLKNDEKRIEMSNLGYNKSKSSHTFRNRVDLLLEIINNYTK